MSFLGGLFSGIGSIVGSSVQANAMEDAAKLQAQEQQLALAQQKQFFNTGLGYEQPIIGTGQQATNTLANAYGLNGTGAQKAFFTNFQTSPFFDNLVKNAAATTEAQAGHGGFSGNLTNALYNQNAGLWQNALNTQLGGIAGLAAAGAGGANAVMGAATSAGNSAANTITQSGLNQGNFISNAGSSLGSGIAGAGNAANNALTNYQLLSMLNGGSGSNMLGGWNTNIMGPAS